MNQGSTFYVGMKLMVSRWHIGTTNLTHSYRLCWKAVTRETIVQMRNTKRSAAAHRTAAVLLGALFLMGCGSDDHHDENERPDAAPLVYPDPVADVSDTTDDFKITDLADSQ